MNRRADLPMPQQLIDRPLVGIARLMQWLGYSSRSEFYRARPKLEKDGFPRPLPGRRPMVWDAAAIVRWLDKWMPADLRDGGRVEVKLDDVEIQNRIAALADRRKQPENA